MVGFLSVLRFPQSPQFLRNLHTSLPNLRLSGFLVLVHEHIKLIVQLFNLLTDVD